MLDAAVGREYGHGYGNHGHRSCHTCQPWHRACGPPLGGTEYEDFFPYYAELCALSELSKKPGFGAPLRSGIGGHSLLYLNGVRLDRAAGYPTLRLCTQGEAPQEYGVGISVNSHYRNANWVAVEGRIFCGAALWRQASG